MLATDYATGLRHTFSSNRGRSALTLLGIMIGTGSIVLLAGLLRSGEEALLSREQFANEADLIRVDRDEPPQKQAAKTRRELGRGDVETLGQSEQLAGIAVAGEIGRDVQARYQTRQKNVRLVSATPGTETLYRLSAERGRFLSKDDLAENHRVCVIGFDVYQTLLEAPTDIDHLSIEVDGHLWTVIGVLKKKAPLGGGGDGTWMWDRKVLVPQPVYDSLYTPTHEFQRIFVRAGLLGNVGKQLAAIESTVNSIMLRRHLDVANFKVQGEKGGHHEDKLILNVIKMLLFSTAILALFVGGINIMNIMLVTVTERTREIGVRRAIGAPPGSILLQFLIEASAIASVGGVIGVAFGVGILGLIALALRHMLGEWAFHVETWSLGVGLLLSLLTGIVFGLFPAWRASKLDPVEALRFE